MKTERWQTAMIVVLLVWSLFSAAWHLLHAKRVNILAGAVNNLVEAIIATNKP